MNKKTQEGLALCLDQLSLSTIRRQYAQLADEARSESLSHEQFLFNLVRQECDSRRNKRIERYLKESHLPLEKTMDCFDLKRLPLKVVQQTKTLIDGEFVVRKENLLIFGNPGSGKTHLASGMGHELIHMEKRVYFATCAMLLQDLLSAKKDLKLKRLLKTFARYDVLIIDDIGYVQQEQKEMEVLFTLLAERYERGSVIITSNLPFSKWNNIFKDPMMTAAAVDRIVHHSVILELNIESYRINAAKKQKVDQKEFGKIPAEDPQ
jgi:DNA replication protein DnaC